jgi:hypothetical protein
MKKMSLKQASRKGWGDAPRHGATMVLLTVTLALSACGGGGG